MYPYPTSVEAPYPHRLQLPGRLLFEGGSPPSAGRHVAGAGTGNPRLAPGRSLLPHGERGGGAVVPMPHGVEPTSVSALLLRLPSRGQRRLKQRLALIRDVEEGLPAREALRRSALNVTERSVEDLVARFRREGLEGLVDRRLLRRVPGRNPRTVRTPLVETIVRRVATQVTENDESGRERPRLTAVRRSVAAQLEVHGLPVPSASTIRRILSMSSEDVSRDEVQP